jgi:3-oxoacyl-[acyl-carrier-protein] synthase-3
MNNRAIGILGLATYIPAPRMTAAQLAQASGLPEGVVRDKLGVVEKVVPGPGDHPHAMAVRAARRALNAAGLAPTDIDVVISITEEYKEHPLWTTGIALTEDLGCLNAWAFDVAQRCGTGVLAVKLARDLITADSRIRHVLVAGGYRNVDLIDYRNPRVRFMYNLAAGAGAVVIGREASGNEILGAALLTDGTFSRDVMAPRGGSVKPLGDWPRPYLDVPDPSGMRARLEAVSMTNFLRVVDEALLASGLTRADIDYLAVLHMKRSAHDAILKALGLRASQSIYLEHYGHVGQIDQILSTELGVAEGRIRAGDHVVWVSAGIGYAWDALVIRWGAGDKA